MREMHAEQRIAAARKAQAQWTRRSVKERVRALRPLREAIVERMDEIIQTISEEIGKTPMDALVGDVMVTLEQLRYYERHAVRLLRARRIGKPWFLFGGTHFLEVHEPHGTVLVFAPWNYPLQLSLVPMLTALFAGNAVLLKCSEHAPRTSRLIADICVNIGLPDGLVQVSCEAPEEASALLECSPDLIFFTGSSRNGRRVAIKAAEFMIPTVMELGGKDAALVFDSCDLERTANGIAYGSFSNAGQVCVGIKRIYVQQTIYDEFLRVFLEKVAAIRIGTTVQSDIGPIPLEAVRSRLRQQVMNAISCGAKVRSRWSQDEEIGLPIVLTDVADDAALLVDESFGPVVCVAPFNSEVEAIELANKCSWALSASVWTGDRTQGERVAMQLQSGSCAVNDVIRNIGNPHVSFGGNRLSGHGRYHGAAGLNAFSRTKVMMVADRTKTTEVHWFPFRASTFARLRGLLSVRHHASSASRWKAFREMWMS